MSAPHVLLLGGHGKVAMYMTPMILNRSWKLTSLIRNPGHESDIRSTYSGSNSKNLDFLISSLEDVKSTEDAGKILNTVKPDYVVWSAGAGGKGGAERTKAIDRDACKHFISASVTSPHVSKFLLVSALSSRRNMASWWDEGSCAMVNKMNKEILKVYYECKLVADDWLAVLGERRAQAPKGGAVDLGEGKGKFQWISLRPGGLSDEGREEGDKGKVHVGKTQAKGMVRRVDVADVGVRLLEHESAKGWFDMVGGEGTCEGEVERVLKEGVDCMEGESYEEMVKAVDSA